MRRWTGLDLNGWHDVAARDWEPEDLNNRIAEARILDGGLESLSVRQESGQWVGGPQAALAPHGRGAGWGKIGAQDRRRRVLDLWRDLLAAPSADTSASWYAAAEALSRNSQSLMLAVPDVPTFDEMAQSRTLAALKGRKRPQARLLWRSVAIFIDALNRDAIPRSLEQQPTIVLVHGADGIEVQRLVLRRVEEFPDHLAPEREGYGQLLFPEFGLEAMHGRLAATMLLANPELAEGRCENSRIPMRLLFGGAVAGDAEILRRNNGTWMEVTAPHFPDDLIPEIQTTSHGIVAAEKILLASPLSSPLLAKLRDRLAKIYPGIEIVPWVSIARGALKAGRLIERGLPHYLDRLTSISLAVMDGDKPSFRSLMPMTATVPANREYVSEPITGLRWGRGKTQIEFFVLKGLEAEDGAEIRHWTVNVDKAPSHDVDVELRLRQTPGQSWAKLSLTSRDWSGLQPIELEWDRLEPDLRSPGEILETLERPNPIVPQRIAEESHIAAWEDDGRVVGLATRLSSLDTATPASIKDLAQAIRRSRWVIELGSSFRPVGTDGHLPAALTLELQRSFDQRLTDVGQQIVDVWQGRTRFKDNSALIFATWAFARCPAQVQDALVDTLERHVAGTSAPLISTNSARVVVIAGSGRAVTGVDRLGRLFRVLAQLPINNIVLSALSSSLSRRVEAPQALTAPLVSQLSGRLNGILRGLVDEGNFKIKFKNALMVLTGLLRYREVEPWAFVRSRSSSAEQLALTLEYAKKVLSKRAQQVPQGAKKLAVVEVLIEYLSGVGGDPNILRQIDELDDAEEESNGES